MIDPVALLAEIRRPRLLIRAAHFGLADYRRDRDLPRLTRRAAAPSPETAFGELMDEERRLEETRRADEAAYSLGRHIEVLIALLAEARLLPAPRAVG